MIILILLLLGYIIYLRKKNRDLSKANQLNFDEQMRLIQEHAADMFKLRKEKESLISNLQHVLNSHSADSHFWEIKDNFRKTTISGLNKRLISLSSPNSLYYHNKTNRIIQLSELTHLGDL